MSVKRISFRKVKLIALFSLVLLVLTIVFDALRAPENQVAARVYVGFVHVYQAVGRPLLKGVITCPFRPTCSDYSIATVERHGIARGLVLTFKRLYSCNGAVPMGTIDDVPD